MYKVKKNFFYQSLYQMLLIILPFVTAPYMSRVLGSEGVGIYSYSSSVTGYFSLVIMLGINIYGNREVARLRTDKKRLEQFFSNIISLHILIGCLCVIIYVLFITIFVNENRLIFVIQLLTLLSSIFDINWFFFGMEEFKVTVTRNITVKLVSVAAIFILVNTNKDVWIYTLIMCVGTFLGQIILWGQLRKHICFVKPDLREAITYIEPMFLLFIPSIAVSIYKQMDKVMLGTMSSYSETGIYEYAEKIINAPIGLITAMGTVMLPAMSNLYANGEKDSALSTIQSSMKFMMFLSWGCLAGLLAVLQDFIPFFFGEDFRECVGVAYVLAFTIPFVAWANVLRTQFLLPVGKDKAYLYSLFCGAVINLFINFTLIPKIGAKGAAFGTLITEVSICVIQSIVTCKDLQMLRYIGDSFAFLVSAVVMLICVKCISHVGIENTVIMILGEIIFGMAIYALINVKYICYLLKGHQSD